MSTNILSIEDIARTVTRKYQNIIPKTVHIGAYVNNKIIFSHTFGRKTLKSSDLTSFSMAGKFLK